MLISALDGYPQVAVRVGITMSTEHLTPQERRVLQVGPLKPSLAQTLRDDYAAYVLPEDSAEREEFLSSHGAEITAVVTSGRTGVDAALMSALPNLGAVVNFGVGYDTTDVDAAAARGVGVSNTPDVLTDCVADTAVGLMIDTLRQFSAADRYRARGPLARRRELPTDPPGQQHPGGHHRSGPDRQRDCKRLSAFGCTISYHNRNRVAGFAVPVRGVAGGAGARCGRA